MNWFQFRGHRGGGDKRPLTTLILRHLKILPQLRPNNHDEFVCLGVKSRKKDCDSSTAKHSSRVLGDDHYKLMSCVTVDVARQRTLTAQWPWVPSKGQNLQPFTGLVVVTHPCVWKIVEWDDQPQTNKNQTLSYLLFVRCSTYKNGSRWIVCNWFRLKPW